MKTARFLSLLAVLRKPGYSTVEPVHHLVRVRKAALSPRYRPLLVPKDDILLVGFRPREIEQDRVAEHFENTVESDLMLRLYEHGAATLVGEKRRLWGPFSPYALYRAHKKPRGTLRPQQDVRPVGPDNVPRIRAVLLNLYNKAALDEPWLNISLKLQLAQLTNVKPKQIYNKANVYQWKVREGKPCGCKVELTGRDMSQFLSTLTELVLPRIRTFKGIKALAGDGNGNLLFGLEPEDVKLFPETENFLDLFPNVFGFHVTIKTTARTDEQARVLATAMGLPVQM